VSWFRKSSSGDAGGVTSAEQAAVATLEVDPLTQDEVDWVRSTIAELAHQDVRVDDIDDLGRHYDELLTGWRRLSESTRPDPHAIVNQIGLAFGQLIANHTGLEWGVATNARGPEIALHRPSTGGALVIYPTDMVAKRWEAGETGVLPALARATIQAVQELPASG
jgi:hypothetical protein